MASRRQDFDEFFAANYAAVLRGLTLATGDRAVAEEATQEAFARAVRKWAKVRTMERPIGWVYVVAMNVARRHLRGNGRDEAQPESPSALDMSGTVTTRVVLRDAVDALPARQRQALVLRYFADLSIADTAAAMRCAPGTVKSAVHSALAALRIELDDETDKADDDEARHHEDGNAH
jgi:RNA polymerase sigma-70 factor (ECF subfamily)